MRAPANASLLLAALLTSLLAARADAQEAQGVPRILIDRGLQERQVQLLGFDDRLIRYNDRTGLIRTEPIADFLALFPQTSVPPPQPAAPAAPPPEPEGEDEPAPAPAPAPFVAVLELTDGQRFTGSLAAGAADQETIRWAHPVLGSLEFKLDQVRRVRLAQPDRPAAPAPAAEDTVLLNNGDRLQGFIESLGATLKFSIQAGQSTEIPLDRVQEITLANPAEAPPPGATLAWLRDGSIIACQAIRTNRAGVLTLVRSLQESEARDDKRTESPGEPGQALTLDDLLAAAFGPGAMLPLATLPAAKQEPTGGRRWTRPALPIDPERAVLAAADVEIPGPMVVEWELPAGASRLLTTAELPSENWTWGDCELIVTLASGAGETELLRQRLSGDAATATVNAALPESAAPRRLRLRLDPGEYGPVQDRIILRRPLLLVQPNPS